jgi:hypothetical protein
MQKNLVKQFFNEYQIEKDDFLRTFYHLLILSAAYFFPFFLRRTYFLDDILRSLDGSLWDYSIGRPFANFFISLFSYKLIWGLESVAQFLDASPINLAISLILLCLSLSIYSQKIFQEKSSWFLSICIFFFIANPFLLQNFAWQFDCIITITALSLALFATTPSKNIIFNLPVGIFIMALSLGTYQSSINIFLAGTALYAFIIFQKSIKDCLWFLLQNFIKVSVALVIYKFLIVANINYLSEYYEDLNRFIDIKNNIFFLIQREVSYITATFKIVESFTILMIFIIFSLLTYFIVETLKSNQAIRFMASFVVTIFMILVSFLGPLILMKFPFFEARVLMAFSIFLLFVSYAFYKVNIWLNNRIKFLIILPLYTCFFISYGFSNVITSQDNYNISIARSIQKQLYAHGFNYQNKIVFEGRIDDAHPNRLAIDEHKLFRHLFRGHLGGYWYSSIYFQNLGLEGKYNRTFELKDSNIAICAQEPLVKDYYYKIFKKDDLYLVAFAIGKCYQYNNPKVDN